MRLDDFTESSRTVKPTASHFSHQALINSGKEVIMLILPYPSVFPPSKAPWDLLFERKKKITEAGLKEGKRA